MYTFVKSAYGIERKVNKKLNFGGPEDRRGEGMGCIAREFYK
jgi:hypothetical protein